MGHYRMGDLMELAAKDAVVHMHFEMWKRGDFQTFEQMLLSIACCQTQRVAELNLYAEKRLREQSPVVVIDKKVGG